MDWIFQPKYDESSSETETKFWQIGPCIFKLFSISGSYKQQAFFVNLWIDVDIAH